MNKNKQNLHKLKYNLCTKYLISSLGLVSTNTSWELFKKFGFINAYLEDKTYPVNIKNSIYLVFAPATSSKNSFLEYLEEIKNHIPNYLDNYEVDDNVWVIIFKIPNNWVYLYDLFLKGQYSKFGKKYGDFFKTSDNGSIVYTNAYKVINKDKDYQEYLEKKLGLELGELDEAELDSVPDEKDYIFDYENIIKQDTICN